MNPSTIYTNITHSTSIDKITQAVILDHHVIGWQNFLKYEIRKHWSSTQTLYYIQHTNIDKQKYSTLWWKKDILLTVKGG